MPQTVGVSAVFDTRQFNSGLNTYVQGLNVAQNATANVTKEVNGLNTAFQAGLGAAVGTAAINAIAGIASALRDLGAQALQTVSEFERLAFSVRTFVAQEFRVEHNIPDFNDALEQTADTAASYQAALEKLAVFSPFTTQEIAQANRLALAYDFNTEQAFRLTEAFIDFSSATGLSVANLNRVFLALGQINTRGNLASQEIRQLSEAGVPVRTILANALGVTQQKFQEMVEKGAIPAGKAIELITQAIERDFGGAGQRIAGTFTGLISSLRDIQELATRDFLTPVFEGFRPTLQALVDTLTSPEFRGALIALGELLGVVVANGVQRVTAFAQGLIQAWQDMDPVVRRNIIVFVAAGAAITVVVGTAAALVAILGLLINPFTVLVGVIAGFVTAMTAGFDKALRVVADTVGAIAQYFADLINEATGWGINIGQALADGIVSAANIIVEAVNIIGEAIGSLLRPGSPPKLLPDLDTWGTEAAEVYLQGWTQADFSILDQMGTQIQRFLRGISEQGGVADIDIPSIVLGSRQSFAQAVQDIKEIGKISEDTFAAIAATAGPAADLVTRFALQYGEVAIATDEVAAAQEELNRVTKTYDALLTPLRNKLQDVSNAREDAQENQKIAALQRLIATRGVSDARKQAAQLEIQEILTQRQVRNLEQQADAAEDVAQTQLTAAQQAQQDAETELALFQQRLQQQNTAIDLQNEQADLLEKQREALEAANVSAQGVTSSLSKALSPLSKQLKLIQLQKAELSDTIKEAKARAVLDDKNATAAQKAAAALELQEIALRRQQRLLEVRELGFKDEDLKKFQQIPITLEDISKKGKPAGDALSSAFDFKGKGIDAGPLDEIRQKTEEFRDKLKEVKQQVIDTATAINENLPSFLKLFPEQEGGEPPILKTLRDMGPAIVVLSGIFVTSKIVESIGILVGLLGIGGAASAAGAGGTGVLGAALAALLTPIGLVALAVAALATAWYFNIGGMQDFTKGFVDEVSRQFDLVKQKFGEKGLVGLIMEGTGAGIKTDTLQTDLSAAISGIEATAEEQGLAVGVKIVTGIKAGINQDGPSVPQTVEQITFLLAGVQPTAEEQAKIVGSATGAALISGMSAGIDSGIAQSESIGSRLAEWGKQLGASIIDGMVAGVNENGPSVPQTAEQVSFLLAGVQPTAEEQGRLIGAAVGDGVVTGIEESESFGSQAMRGFMRFLFGKAAEEAEIKSPSALFAREIGKPIGEGVVAGINEANADNDAFFGLIGKIIAAFVGLTVSVLATVGAFVGPLTAAFDTAGQTIFTATETMALNVNEQYTLLSTNVITTVTLLAENLVLQFTTLQTNVVTITTTMRTLTVEQYNQMRTEVNESVTALSTDLIAAITTLTDTIVGLFSAMREGVIAELNTMRTDVVDALGPNGLLGEILELDESYKEAGVALGKAMLDGVRQGVRDADSVADVLDAIDGLAKKIESRLKEAFAISSPSKLTETRIGAPIVEGIAAGMRSQIGAVVAAAQDIAAQTIGALQGASAQVSAQPSGFIPNNTSNVSNVSNFNLNVTSAASSQGIINDFSIMEVLAGV